MMNEEEAERMMILVSALVHVARNNEKKWPLGIGMPEEFSRKEVDAWNDVQDFVDFLTKG
jgi:hypothetical protein